jgi:hypothetical protein
MYLNVFVFRGKNIYVADVKITDFPSGIVTGCITNPELVGKRVYPRYGIQDAFEAGFRIED